MKQISLQIYDEAALSPRLDLQIRQGLQYCFPKDAATFARNRAWHGSVPAFTGVVEREGQVIAHAGVVDRRVAYGARPLRTAGIQNVFVLPQWRGHGLCGRVLNRLMEEAGARGFDVGLLFCLPALEAIYAALGWQRLDGREVFLQNEPGSPQRLNNDNFVMAFRLNSPIPCEEKIHLMGNDW